MAKNPPTMQEIWVQSLNSEREKEISSINTYMWKLENGVGDLIYKAEIETQM